MEHSNSWNYNCSNFPSAFALTFTIGSVNMFWFVILFSFLAILFGKTEMHRERWSGLVPWPQRLTAAPPRLEEIGITAEEFQKDTVSHRNFKKTLSYWN